MGFRIAAIARGADRRELAVKLGAYIYVDSLEQNAAEALQKLGGACSVILSRTRERYLGLLSRSLHDPLSYCFD
jgi:D-arabinose 1-dehydrogenase-like Zn-dependent alcohol dehydrogenase